MQLRQIATCSVALLLGLCLIHSQARAVLVDWDPDGNQTSDGGAGTWSTTDANWDDDGSAPNVAWTNGDDANFGDSGGNYTVSVATGSVVTVTDLSYQGSSQLTFASSLGDSIITLAGNATWNTGGGNIQFASNQSGAANLGDVGLNLAGNTLTVNGGGIFDAGERGNGVNWGAGNLVFTEATTVRGANYNIGQLNTVTMAGGSFIMERNNNQDFNNDWVLNGDTTFDNRFNGRSVFANGEFSGTGRLTVRGMGTNAGGGAGVFRLNDTNNSWSGGLTVDGSSNTTVVNVVGGDAVLGAVPGSFDADNIILKDGGALKLFAFALNANRGITLEGSGGTIISANGVNTINGAITGEGSLQIGRPSDASQNVVLLNSSANDYQGDTKVVRGTLRLGVNNATPAGSVLVIGGAAGGNASRFDMNGLNTTVGGLSLAGNNTREIQNTGASASILTIDVADGESYAYGANFSGSSAVNIVKTGAGTQTFSRVGGYTTALGDVAVNGGELVWNNNTGSTIGGTVSVGANGTLSGTGVIGGATTVAGNLNPGNSPGTLTFEQALTLESTATLTLEFVSTAAGDFDVVANDGGDTLTVAGILALDSTGYSASEGDSFLVFDNWQDLTGSFSSISGVDLGSGLAFDTSNLLINGTLTVVAAVPEASSVLCLSVLLAGFALKRRGSAISKRHVDTPAS